MRFHRKGVEHQSIKEISFEDGTLIGVFEGNRGAIPEHDILIRYKELGKRMRTPKHIHWVIDLLIKKEHDGPLTLRFMKFLREMYDRVDAFSSAADRLACVISGTDSAMLEPFIALNQYGEYKIEFIATLIELMIRMEKNTPPGKPAYVFKELMDALIEEKEIFVIVSKATQTG